MTLTATITLDDWAMTALCAGGLLGACLVLGWLVLLWCGARAAADADRRLDAARGDWGR